MKIKLENHYDDFVDIEVEGVDYRVSAYRNEEGTLKLNTKVLEGSY